VFTGKIIAIFVVMMIVSGLFASYFERKKNATLRNVFVISTLIEGIYFILAGFNKSIADFRFILIGGILLYVCINVLRGKQKFIIWRKDLTDCDDAQSNSFDSTERFYGYGNKFSLITMHLNLVTSDQYFKFNYYTFFSKEYKWTEVLACYKTNFLMKMLEKLVIITTDGRYFTIQGSIGELPYYREQIKSVTKAGGIAYNELFSRFHEAAIIKHVNNPATVCNWDTFFQTILALVFFAFHEFIKAPAKRHMTIVMILVVLLAFELYCILAMERYAKRLSNFMHPTNHTTIG
jgi:hypothetical protein